MQEQKKKRIKELITLLNAASKAYYSENREIMSNYEYDKLYDELVELEEETGIIIGNSPTQYVGYASVEELPKEKHKITMLSLEKTKNLEELQEWLKAEEAILSWKLDGLTVVLTYHDGKLAKAVTRGNGEIGEVVTNNAKVFDNLPIAISFKEELIIRGEAVITYSDFAHINAQIPDADARYKNPRNLCSGSVRQLNNEVTAARKVKFFAFSLVTAEGVDFHNKRENQLLFLKEQGFDIVEYKKVTNETIKETVQAFEQRIKTNDVPSDGLVIMLNDLEYSRSLGTTAKFPRDSLAFKWMDEQKETVLKEIEWSPSRTGLINPVAIFEPVELEGTTVSRASVHNISIMQGLELGIGDTITVYKANMIIPQIAENLTRSNQVEIPGHCPVCGGSTAIKKVNEVKSLYCTNMDCVVKKIKSFTLFVSRDAMNIEGLSEATLEKFVGKGYIHTYADIFRLERYKEDIIEMEGFGIKSYENLISSIDISRKTTLPRLLYALGIANIGVATAKIICRQFRYDLSAMRSAGVEELSEIDGIGGVIAAAYCDYFADKKNNGILDDLITELNIQGEQQETGELPFNKMSFVITGSLVRYENRNELKEVIERLGGKVTGSVTGKTTCLINNDIQSTSSKNKKAKELGVPILTEEDFMAQYLDRV